MRGKQGWNHNVVTTYVFRCSYALSIGLWNFGNGSTYVFLLEHRSNKLVGISQMIQGTFMAGAALPAGWLADHYRRDSVLRLAGVIAAGAIATMVLCVSVAQQPLHLWLLHTDLKYFLFCVSSALWGTTTGFAQSAVEAILGDSVPTGSRSQVYNSMFAAMAATGAFGPLISSALFLGSGNTWDLHSLQLVLLAGMAVSVVPTAAYFFFDDDKTLGAASQGLLATELQRRQTADEELAEAAKKEMVHHRRCRLPLAWLPFILCFSDCILSLGSGMTIKYFPIWLFDVVGLQPSIVNYVQAAVPFMLAACALLTQKVSTGIGRVQAVMLVRTLAVGLLLFMALCRWTWARPYIILPVYVLRFALANCSWAISKSILNDYVPKESRARWNSVESILQFGWSGSAVVGGLIIDRYSYAASFIVTAAVQFMGVISLVPLLPMVPREESGVFDDGTAAIVAEHISHRQSLNSNFDVGDLETEEHAGALQQAVPVLHHQPAGDLQEPLLPTSPRS